MLGICADAGAPVFVVDAPRQVLGGIAARVYGEPAQALQMLGITGTNGKTTVASMVESGLRAAGPHDGAHRHGRGCASRGRRIPVRGRHRRPPTFTPRSR